MLIVSGSEEITIDEIGEISDHIQDEAGHSANIIMGVGEDVSLEGAIAITVIATGFDAEQQDEIVNAETTRIIHTLEDEQRAEHDLTASPIRPTMEMPVSTPPKADTVAEPEVIRHELVEEEPEAIADQEIPFEGYVQTTDLIKNIEVESTLIDIHYLAEFEQIQINEIDVNQFTIVEPEEEPVADGKKEVEEQMLMFDLPINQPSQHEPVLQTEKQPVAEEPELLVHNLEDIEVKDAVEVVPVTEVSEEGVKRYSLDDYEEMENHLNSARPEEEEVEFSTRTVESPAEEEVSEENADPLNSPISKLLRDRTDERRRKMKEFNYKFRNSASKIDEIEKQPAYKRMGIELDETDPSESNISRTSINTDDDDIDLRSNNSFLHDNVD